MVKEKDSSDSYKLQGTYKLPRGRSSLVIKKALCRRERVLPGGEKKGGGSYSKVGDAVLLMSSKEGPPSTV